MTVLSHVANLAATTAGLFSEAIEALRVERADKSCMMVDLGFGEFRLEIDNGLH